MRYSLQSKIFILFILAIIVSVSIVGWYGLSSSTTAYIDSAYKLSYQHAEATKIEIEDKLSPITEDIKYISSLHSLNKFIIWNNIGVKRKSDQFLNIFEKSVIKFLETKMIYLNIRLIDINGNEMFVARYNENSGKATIIPKSDLQNKKGRDYVEKTKLLEKGEFFISDINLNIEHGKIQKPHIPVLRYATPLIDSNGELKGLFVVNLYAHHILDIIDDSIFNRDNLYYLVDQDGNYIYNLDKKKRWGSQLNNGYNFNNEHFNLNNTILNSYSGTFELNNHIYSYERVYPYAELEDNYWYLITSTEKKAALQTLQDFYFIFGLIILFIAIFNFFTVRWFISKITLPLKGVSEVLKSLSLGVISKQKIVYRADDEVADIVNSTTKVLNAIEHTIIQANSVSNGDFSKEIQLLSDNDSLGIAIREMTNRLSTIAKLSLEISHGNYEVEVDVKSSHDILGTSLRDMVMYLQDITKIATSISSGDLNVKHSVRSKRDKLGSALNDMTKYLQSILHHANLISQSDFTTTIVPKSEYDSLGNSIAVMTNILRENKINSENDIWFSDGVSNFSASLGGITDTTQLSSISIKNASKYIGANSGVLYLLSDDKSTLLLKAYYSFIVRDGSYNSFKLGEGFIGQVALEKEPVLLENIEYSTHTIQSGTQKIDTKSIYTLPIIYDGILYGVMECASNKNITKLECAYLDRVATIFAIQLNATAQSSTIKSLLNESQKAYEELQVRSEELQKTNIQMEEQQQQLTIQAKEMKIKNNALIEARDELDERADALEKSSKYKSEFLANMSHELRTPLNSIILLSKLLAQNKSTQMSEDDISKSSVINKAGNDLLLLINDILDLSKVESGAMELNESNTHTSEIIYELQGLFSEIANQRGISFNMDDKFNNEFYVDKTKLMQIIKNLLSNAFKFTKEGSVKMSIATTPSNITFAISDSGIGIPNDKLKQIFEAFKQVDGSISREYGGTGLGLSISKTFVDLMGGSIEVYSQEKEGSTFSIILPLKYSNEISLPKVDKKIENNDIIIANDINILDDNLLQDTNILIIDDDSRNVFTISSILQELGAETYSASNPKDGLEFLIKEGEDIDIIIIDGLESIEIIKDNNNFANIPIIIIIDNTEENKSKCLKMGINDCLSKPVDQSRLVSTIKTLLK